MRKQWKAGLVGSERQPGRGSGERGGEQIVKLSVHAGGLHKDGDSDCSHGERAERDGRAEDGKDTEVDEDEFRENTRAGRNLVLLQRKAAHLLRLLPPHTLAASRERFVFNLPHQPTFKQKHAMSRDGNLRCLVMTTSR
eukprot:764767-Hanusia_phi.AAC.2